VVCNLLFGFIYHHANWEGNSHGRCFIIGAKKNNRTYVLLLGCGRIALVGKIIKRLFCLKFRRLFRALMFSQAMICVETRTTREKGVRGWDCKWPKRGRGRGGYRIKTTLRVYPLAGTRRQWGKQARALDFSPSLRVQGSVVEWRVMSDCINCIFLVW
jgi:hypothetical protein